jgi:hypothetical protein
VFTRTRFKLLNRSNLHNKVLWLLVLNFTGSPIHPPPSRCSQTLPRIFFFSLAPAPSAPSPSRRSASASPTAVAELSLPGLVRALHLPLPHPSSSRSARHGHAQLSSCSSPWPSRPLVVELGFELSSHGCLLHCVVVQLTQPHAR